MLAQIFCGVVLQWLAQKPLVPGVLSLILGWGEKFSGSGSTLLESFAGMLIH